MNRTFVISIFFSLAVLAVSAQRQVDPSKFKGLVCFWNFNGDEKFPERAAAGHDYALQEGTPGIEKVRDGLFGPWSVRLREGQWLYVPRKECPALNLHGAKAGVTVVAWIKRGQKKTTECQAIAGMWNETQRKRQYCLFLDLGIWESAQQVCGHISGVGGPTPGYRYCMDASIGLTPVPLHEWQCVALSYDGQFIRSYLNGALDSRPERNPYPYALGIFDGGEDGADFTVGSVTRSGRMGNFFVGQIAGIAVYDRALSDKELKYLARNIAR